MVSRNDEAEACRDVRFSWKSEELVQQRRGGCDGTCTVRSWEAWCSMHTATRRRAYGHTVRDGKKTRVPSKRTGNFLSRRSEAGKPRGAGARLGACLGVGGKLSDFGWTPDDDGRPWSEGFRAQIPGKGTTRPRLSRLDSLLSEMTETKQVAAAGVKAAEVDLDRLVAHAEARTGEWLIKRCLRAQSRGLGPITAKRRRREEERRGRRAC